MEAREISARLVSRRLDPLPEGADEWVRTHPAEAEHLASEVAALRPWEYLQFEFELRVLAWGAADECARTVIADALEDGKNQLRWSGRWRVERFRDWYPGRDREEDEVFSCRAVTQVFPGVSEREARRLLLQRVSEGDRNPRKHRGTWRAPLRWWRSVLPERNYR